MGYDTAFLSFLFSSGSLLLLLWNGGGGGLGGIGAGAGTACRGAGIPCLFIYALACLVACFIRLFACYLITRNHSMYVVLRLESSRNTIHSVKTSDIMSGCVVNNTGSRWAYLELQ